jgi:hypothetical protein
MNSFVEEKLPHSKQILNYLQMEKSPQKDLQF